MSFMVEQFRDQAVCDGSPCVWEDEIELVEKAKADSEAFGRLYDRYYSVILNYVYHRTLDVALAEELTSNTFFNALRSLARYRNSGKFAPWLYSIAGNEIRLSWRKWRNQRNGQDRWRDELHRVQFAAGPSLPLEEVEAQAYQFSRIQQALSCLPERYQTVLALRYFESLSYEEIADVIETKVGTVKSLIHRGLARLKKQFEGDGATFSPVLNYPMRKERKP
jgi:RNA polymerase sigma-70 factor, ECF subfamily